jgi:predicted MFS family arabinose efflux permease
MASKAERTIINAAALVQGISMVLLLASTLVKSDQAAAYPMLLVATAFLGAGFGLTVPVLNTYTSVFNPDSVDRSVLTLNALLGLGTALAPVLVAIFVGLGFWWGLPILSTVLLAGLLLISLRLPLRAGARAAAGRQGSQARPGLPARFWLYAAFAVCYGICETMNGNWSQLDMTTRLGASATQASLALAAFWAMVTVGRVLFAAIGRWLPERATYRILPFVLVGTFLLTGVLSRPHAAAGIAVFALAGLGCSALLPLTISFGEGDLTAMAAAMAGGVIAFYQLGYGIAAFGVGPLVDSGVSLSRIFGFTAIIAAVLALLSFFVTRRPALAGLAAGPDAALPVSTSRPLASDPGDLRSESSPEG